MRNAAIWPMQTEHVAVLEFDELPLRLGQEDTAHEARNAQLLDDFEQVDLGVEAFQALSKKQVTLLSPVAEAPAASDTEPTLPEVGAESLTPCIAENLARLDCFFQVLTHCLLLGCVLLLMVVMVMMRAPMRVDFLEHRLVDRK
eukprot:CAMPEP_0185622510 /NCGR_PEP_ID=MMETSP0436-20130131/59276_1 /TAXON_ID=626734 ORGANISM="Favella taraikaensis, Strain Fe Narragansett Bay" /NCGR_SAMPLE_ID=MMETSP0436 /ASSEMBLY_ACC=CAM_ASM_000390 /LENGTH=143 /DNA_ID=CAMNT_0028264279 /DNA_START=691 /DNA_END=1122 /DNA_ORIENTATION=+